MRRPLAWRTCWLAAISSISSRVQADCSSDRSQRAVAGSESPLSAGRAGAQTSCAAQPARSRRLPTLGHAGAATCSRRRAIVRGGPLAPSSTAGWSRAQRPPSTLATAGSRQRPQHASAATSSTSFSAVAAAAACTAAASRPRQPARPAQPEAAQRADSQLPVGLLLPAAAAGLEDGCGAPARAARADPRRVSCGRAHSRVVGVAWR